ncbi:endoglucanase [Krasilnikovia cinnamomea]|uniref:Glucanase n=1 Tax=Krasilnikovia cinnamomea TaxID=349313 RepID=A0A4Q7ZTN7_9ACTN|nr:glycoside hydrolase family 6 protein [Krasilnikovia cinnamomea]RZU53905.1 endoglucanase [Krasilnikovia cinnamomea]
MAAHARAPRPAARLLPVVAAVVVAGVVTAALWRGGDAGQDPVSPRASTSAHPGGPAVAPPSGPAAAAPPSGPAGVAGPLSGAALYLDRTGAAAKQVTAYEKAGRDADARLIRRIADQPAATWFGDASSGTAARARALVTAATRAGRLPVLTMYNIPHRDCAGHSRGGASSADAYRTYVAAMANALRGHRAVVILEPDAVAQAVQGCLDAARKAERFALLAEAIGTLRANPGVTVYLDAGNPTWITDLAQLATALREAGIERGNGFALNVANFETTADNVAYGTALSQRLGGAHFVVDTSRNGNGPAPRGATPDGHWCNPPGRRLGQPPTTDTGQPLVDAYLWIKRPGESDGACGNGAPPAGQWWADYALGLSRS